MRFLVAAVLLFGHVAMADEQQTSELARLLGSGESGGFEKALGPREFTFPEDHGPHEKFRNEWWYVTGNVDADNGDRYGYELTIFRFALAPDRVESPSAFRTNQIYIAHLALTDVEGQRFLVAEKYSRAAAGLSGASVEPFRVWIDDWSIADAGDGTWRLSAASEDFSIDVRLLATKPPVLNGVNGLSQKSSEPGNASYYYSISRLKTSGTIELDGRLLSVSGESWLDREWSTSALSQDQVGWDWFALQLSDQTELMFYNLRKLDGSQDSTSSGTRIDANARSWSLGHQDVELTVTDTWESPAGGRYPAGWTLVVPDEDLRLEITPVLADQELFTLVRYWEGAVDVRGTRGGELIEGRGYVELTGYAESQD